MNTPTASANPIDLMIGSWLNTKPPNTATMISAAAVTTRPLCATPCVTAPAASPVCWWCSRIRLTRNTS